MKTIAIIITLALAACGVEPPTAQPPTAETAQDIVTTCGIPAVQCFPDGNGFINMIGGTGNGGLSDPNVWCSRACTGSDIGQAHCPEYAGWEREYCFRHPGEIRNGQYWCWNIYPVYPHLCLSGDEP